ncbi:MAG: hypothetical protein F6K26_00735 [Moorea sp. SIO2I5]|nr:hypothetical protein [Moorena sp. SIO2I5]
MDIRGIDFRGQSLRSNSKLSIQNSKISHELIRGLKQRCIPIPYSLLPTPYSLLPVPPSLYY